MSIAIVRRHHRLCTGASVPSVHRGPSVRKDHIALLLIRKLSGLFGNECSHLSAVTKLPLHVQVGAWVSRGTLQHRSCWQGVECAMEVIDYLAVHLQSYAEWNPSMRDVLQTAVVPFCVTSGAMMALPSNMHIGGYHTRCGHACRCGTE